MPVQMASLSENQTENKYCRGSCPVHTNPVHVGGKGCRALQLLDDHFGWEREYPSEHGGISRVDAHLRLRFPRTQWEGLV